MFFLLRHGQTAWNADNNRYCGRSDISLTAKGIQQAELVRDQLKGFTFDGVYSSPLERAFMTAAIANGGLGLDDRTASAIYGLYISGTYLTSLLGGWIADRLIGQQRAVVWGGVMIMLGNGCLATGNTQLFFIGLMVIVLGVGLLKPNISAIVAQLYPEGGSRRDAGFSIFYMGINTGAFLGSTLVPIAAAAWGWNVGFGLGAIGMLLGTARRADAEKVRRTRPPSSTPDPASRRRF